MLTYITWWKFWAASGKWKQRGRLKDQYVMARFGDVGPYSLSNIKIITCGANVAESNINTGCSKETRAKLSVINSGKKMSEESRRKMSIAQSGRVLSEQEKMRVSAMGKTWKGKKRGEVFGRKMSKIAKDIWRNNEQRRLQVSIRHTGKTISPESRAKMSLAKLGKRLSIETREKMSAAHKARHKIVNDLK